MKAGSVLIAGAAAAAVLGLAAGGAHYYYEVSWGDGCARCHEIRDNYDAWHGSTHRKINCTECHESSVRTNLRRVTTHLRGEVPDKLHLAAEDVFRMVDKCKACHRQEFAQWSAGPHSTTYARLLTDPEHNHKRLLMDDCLSCHVVHREGAPMLKGSRLGATQEILRPSIGLYDRRARGNISATMLPIPAMLEGGRAVKMSPDVRQSLCYQCHAAEPAMQVGTGDDRTPVGVHEGLSCLACHQKHGQDTRASCANCHPRLSNCGIDVEKMDTTFRDPKSKHNVHFVKCADCHPKGIPKKKQTDR